MNAADTADEHAALCVLTSLPKLGPARLRWLLHESSATDVLSALHRRRLPPNVLPDARPRGVSDDLCRHWFDAASALDPDHLLHAHDQAGITVMTSGDPRWPFTHDPDPPVAVFALGDPDHLDAPDVVAIVGTRRSTAIGRRAAFQLGLDLTEGGFAVVSGLALGIDGAAHRGALAASNEIAFSRPPIGVVAGGLDYIYPPRHRELWAEVAERGVLMSECPLGVRPERWRFPARNRLIAGLADLVVVVESHASGGALLTVDEAADRGVPVAAVPGSVFSEAAAGTNALLVEGCPPIRHATDVFDLLGGPRHQLHDSEPAPLPFGTDLSGDRPPATAGASPDPLAGFVLAELSNGELHLEALLARFPTHLSCSLPELVTLVRRLDTEGLVALAGNRVRRAEPGQLP